MLLSTINNVCFCLICIRREDTLRRKFETKDNDLKIVIRL